MKPHRIAEIVHEANRVYCESIGDYSQKNWNESPEWQKESVFSGVMCIIEDPNTTPLEIK